MYSGRNSLQTEKLENWTGTSIFVKTWTLLPAKGIRTTADTTTSTFGRPRSFSRTLTQRGGRSFHHLTVFNCLVLSQNPSSTPSRSFVFYCFGFQIHETSLLRISRVGDFWYFCLLYTRQIRVRQESRCIYDTRKQVAKLCITRRTVSEEKSIARLSGLVYLKQAFVNCGICGAKGVWVLVYLISVGARKVYDTHTANEMSIDPHVYEETWLVVIDALTKRFETRRVLQKTHDFSASSLSNARQRRTRMRFQFSKATKKYCHIFTAMQKVEYFSWSKAI